FVKAEMKKKVPYKPSVQIRTTCQVITATCTCPAGGTPAFCKHVFALLHAINDYIAKKLYEAPTERLQTWHQPKPVKMVPQTSEEVFMREPAIAVENEIGYTRAFGDGPRNFEPWSSDVDDTRAGTPFP
ncbi:SWIM-type domain-containing protein, partial [Trichonephila clavipes]